MTEFIYGTELNLALENMIISAKEYLWFISPYIKLHDRIKDELKRRKDEHELEIVFVFGKNEDDVSKSMSKEDISFLKEFPNVQICYEKNLHAKFYASEKFSLLTSMNLHQFSQNTNIEAGILMQPKNTLKQLADIAFNKFDVGDSALAYFEDIIKHSEKLYKKTPQYESVMLGLRKKYTGSKIEFDKSDSIIASSKSDYKSSPKSNDFNQLYSKNNPQYQEPQTGYCIRTGTPIEFNPLRPFCYEAYQIWVQFENWDFAENYCHLTGQPSYGKTSMRNPILM